MQTAMRITQRMHVQPKKSERNKTSDIFGTQTTCMQFARFSADMLHLTSLHFI